MEISWKLGAEQREREEGSQLIGIKKGKTINKT